MNQERVTKAQERGVHMRERRKDVLTSQSDQVWREETSAELEPNLRHSLRKQLHKDTSHQLRTKPCRLPLLITSQGQQVPQLRSAVGLSRALPTLRPDLSRDVPLDIQLQPRCQLHFKCSAILLDLAIGRPEALLLQVPCQW